MHPGFQTVGMDNISGPGLFILMNGIKVHEIDIPWVSYIFIGLIFFPDST